MSFHFNFFEILYSSRSATFNHSISTHIHRFNSLAYFIFCHLFIQFFHFMLTITLTFHFMLFLKIIVIKIFFLYYNCFHCSIIRCLCNLYDWSISSVSVSSYDGIFCVLMLSRYENLFTGPNRKIISMPTVN